MLALKNWFKVQYYEFIYLNPLNCNLINSKLPISIKLKFDLLYI